MHAAPRLSRDDHFYKPFPFYNISSSSLYSWARLPLLIASQQRALRISGQEYLERVQEGCSSGSMPLGVLSGGFSRPSKSSEHEANHREIHHTFATAR